MNFFDYKTDLHRELTDELLSTSHMRIERIVSAGQVSDWYDQDEDEWVLVAEGEARLLIEERSSGKQKEVTLKRGDHLFLPAHFRHKVTYTAHPTVWLCVFTEP